jgi:hypothetical protein
MSFSRDNLNGNDELFSQFFLAAPMTVQEVLAAR